MSDYEIKNGWILCKLSVCDKKQNDMGIESPTEWVRAAFRISDINHFCDSGDDGEFAGCSTIYTHNVMFTIAVPFDVLLDEIIFGDV